MNLHRDTPVAMGYLANQPFNNNNKTTGDYTKNYL